MTKSTSPDSSATSTETEVEKTEEVKAESSEKTAQEAPKEAKASKKPAESPAEMICHPGEGRYYHQLTSVTSGLTIGVLALMTFLLTIGYSRPHNEFKYSLYASLGLLGLGLVMPVVAHLFKGTPGHKYVRIVQQVVFVAGVVAVVCLAIATANFFFAIPTQPGASAQ